MSKHCNEEDGAERSERSEKASDTECLVESRITYLMDHILRANEAWPTLVIVRLNPKFSVYKIYAYVPYIPIDSKFSSTRDSWPSPLYFCAKDYFDCLLSLATLSLHSRSLVIIVRRGMRKWYSG